MFLVCDLVGGVVVCWLVFGVFGLVLFGRVVGSGSEMG
jgi:hypothetical protein